MFYPYFEIQIFFTPLKNKKVVLLSAKGYQQHPYLNVNTAEVSFNVIPQTNDLSLYQGSYVIGILCFLDIPEKY